jgi:tripeptide aminopeptidase
VDHVPFTSPLAASLAPELLQRLDRYARIDTQSRRDRTSCPSTPGQLDLAHMLASELRAAGLTQVELDDNGYVTATLPAAGGRSEGPVIGLLAHMDTSPDAPGRGVEPVVHRGYDGGVIELPRDGTRLDPARMPELSAAIGHDLVTSSGDTLLGADDKAGVAEVMTAVSYLAAHPELPRPTIRVGFTPDEEIGEGATLFDLARFGARCAYTLDGSALGELQDESFSAVEAIVTVRGIDVHPGQAQGKLVNALRVVSRIVAALPDALSPERTGGRDGFIHPYELIGSAAQAELRAILRDFDDDKLDGYVELLRRTAQEAVAATSGAELELEVRRQYRNMRRYLEQDPEVVAAAETAFREEGIEPVRTPIRGGTDGSRLSEMGLPTPNIFTGGHEYHSVREWASLHEMAAAAATIVRLAGVWTRAEYANGPGATRPAG